MAMRFMVTDKTCTTAVFIDFLNRLLFKRREPVFLIVDGHPVHGSKKVKAFVESTEGNYGYIIWPNTRLN
jgi:hypothetical protein